VNRFFIVRSFPVDRTLNRNATQFGEDVTATSAGDCRKDWSAYDGYVQTAAV
jgi:hypothetical protein